MPSLCAGRVSTGPLLAEHIRMVWRGRGGASVPCAGGGAGEAALPARVPRPGIPDLPSRAPFRYFRNPRPAPAIPHHRPSPPADRPATEDAPMPDPADPRPTLAAPDDDPWLWLEEVEGERALAWVGTQNAATLAHLADARFESDRAAVKAALDRPDKLPFVTRRGGLLYNFWQDATHPRGLWRRTSLESYRSPSPSWEILLDLDAVARA